MIFRCFTCHPQFSPVLFLLDKYRLVKKAFTVLPVIKGGGRSTLFTLVSLNRTFAVTFKPVGTGREQEQGFPNQNKSLKGYSL